MSADPPSASVSLRSILARNTLFNALGRAWEAVLSLVLMGYSIRTVGEAGWGLWSLAAVFTSYAALIDVGIGSGLSKYVAERSARDGVKGVSAVVSAGVLFYTAVGAAMLGAGWLLLDSLLAFMRGLNPGANGGGASEAEMRFLFRGALLLFVANNCAAPFAAVPVGLQRIGLSNLASAASAVVRAAATVFFLEGGWGVRGLLYASSAAFVVQTVCGVAIAWYLAPGLRLGPQWTNWDTFGQLYQFGWRAQVARLANLVNFQTDRAVVWALSHFGSTGQVGLYAVAESVAGKMRQLPGLLVSAMVPAASDLDARGEEDRLRELYVRSSKYMGALAAPLAVYFAACAPMLIRIIAGAPADMEKTAWVLRILLAGYLFNLLPAPGVSIVLGKGRADLQMYAGLVSMAVNIACTVALTVFFGFYGIPLGTSLGMVLSTLWFLRAARGVLGVPAGELCRISLAWPLAASVPGGLLCLLAQQWLHAQTGLVVNLLGASASLALLGISYVVLLGRTPFLDRFDVEFMATTLRLGKTPGFRWLTRSKGL